MKMRPGFDKYLARVGATPAAQLAWVFRVLNLYRAHQGTDWLPGDWDNVSRELVVFAGYGKALLGWGGVQLDHGEIVERPSPKEVRTILASFQQMVEDAEHHRMIRVPTVEMKQELRWLPQAGRYLLLEEPVGQATWEDRARYALAYRLKEEAHRVQRCPAKLPHVGKRCGSYFLKSKRQKYCSKTCTSREMTRAKRQRDECIAHTRVKKGGKQHGTKRSR
jgi:hypothetical protein